MDNGGQKAVGPVSERYATCGALNRLVIFKLRLNLAAPLSLSVTCMSTASDSRTFAYKEIQVGGPWAADLLKETYQDVMTNDRYLDRELPQLFTVVHSEKSVDSVPTSPIHHSEEGRAE